MKIYKNDIIYKYTNISLNKVWPQRSLRSNKVNFLYKKKCIMLNKKDSNFVLYEVCLKLVFAITFKSFKESQLLILK